MRHLYKLLKKKTNTESVKLSLQTTRNGNLLTFLLAGKMGILQYTLIRNSLIRVNIISCLVNSFIKYFQVGDLDLKFKDGIMVNRV